MTVIRSRDNARIKSWARLAEDPSERRHRGLALIEGVHLVETFLGKGGIPDSLIVSEAALTNPAVSSLVRRSTVAPFVLDDALFKRFSDARSPAGIAAEIRIPEAQVEPPSSPACVFLEGLQDAGNVGAIIRSAAAFGMADVVLGRGCADAWSPKALRAGMGGHFFLRIAMTDDLPDAVRQFGRDTICTVARGGTALGSLDLTGRIGWIFGNEGAGVSSEVSGVATCAGTIATPGQTESLNVAASAAICFYERQRQVSTRGAGA